MSENDLDMVLEWRNAPEVRDFMLTRQAISSAAHREWFATCDQDPARVLLIFEIDHEPAGHVNFKIDLARRMADWGFYVRPGAPKGTGRVMMNKALEYGFCTLDLDKISGQVLSSNVRSLKLHEALGFSREAVLRDQTGHDGAQFDLVCYGLMSEEWSAHKGN